MSDLKTKPTGDSVKAFIQSIDDDQKRKDCKTVMDMMSDATGDKPKLWGPSIVGFGKYHYKYESGREGDWFLTGFSPRKQALTLYIMPGFSRYDELMQNLGKYKTGKSCLYIKKLDDINLSILRNLIEESVQYMKTNFPQ